MATAALRESDASEERNEKRLWTYDEMLAELPETNVPMELWDGQLIISPTPTPNHQRIVSRFWQALQQFVSERNLGEAFISPLDVILTPTLVVQPDVFYVSTSNKIVQDRIRGVPDLCMEVISRTWRRDRIDKKELYRDFGVKEYWIIDPERRSIDVFELADRAYRLHTQAADAQPARSKLLEGFTVSFNQLLV
jgi:Uma2 family endonuclease